MIPPRHRLPLPVIRRRSPPSELIGLGAPHGPRRQGQRNHSTTDNSRTLLIPSPPRLLLLCNICLSLGGFGRKGGGYANCRGIPFRISMFRDAFLHAGPLFPIRSGCVGVSVLSVCSDFYCVCIKVQSTQGRGPTHAVTHHCLFCWSVAAWICRHPLYSLTALHNVPS